MITWFYGNTGAGKTTIAKAFAKGSGAILLDGDDLRRVWVDLGLSKRDRREQNNRVYRLALRLEAQGFDVAVAVICPYRDQREIFSGKCKMVYVPGGKSGDDYPFEMP